MPTRKQRRRELKSKRHEYETVWLDADGNELTEPPEGVEQEKKARANGAKSVTSSSKQPASRGTRREPQPPSWNRAVKRAGMLGIVVFFLFSLTTHASNRYVAALIPAAIYTAMFIPFTYLIDRFAYRRYQARLAAGGTTPRPAKKR
jgi:hypothetical protein